MKGFMNSFKNLIHSGVCLGGVNLLGPSTANLLAASVEGRPWLFLTYTQNQNCRVSIGLCQDDDLDSMMCQTHLVKVESGTMSLGQLF